jgi:transcriptional regulator with XRE-family HTH domain
MIIHHSEKAALPRTEQVCGEQVKYFRHLLGWTQDELARRSGYSDRLIRKAEGGRTLALETINNIAESLCCNGLQVCANDLILSPKRAVHELIRCVTSRSVDMRSIHAITAQDCEVDFQADARVPFSGRWLKPDGLCRWLKTFSECVDEEVKRENPVFAIDEQMAFIQLSLAFRHKESVSESFEIVMGIRFADNKIQNIHVIAEAYKLCLFYSGF